METLLHKTTSKRKKRKTRRCLDELRKRSINVKKDTTVKNIVNTDTSVINPKGVLRRNKNYLTSQRLTLSMLGKAVRSETITRPLLSDRKLDISPMFNINVCSQRVTPERAITTSPRNLRVESNRISDQFYNNIFTAHSDCENSLNFHHDENSSDFLSLHSSTEKGRIRRYLESNDDTTSTDTSIYRSNEEFGYHLYEEFLAEIPLYVRKNHSQLTQYDFMSEAKTCLHKLYMERSHQDNSDDIGIMPSKLNTGFLTRDRSILAPLETIVEDPMDYIKLRWQEDSHHSLESTPSDPSMSPLQSPFVAVQPQSSMTSHTPDYIFYPHRLGAIHKVRHT